MTAQAVEVPSARSPGRGPAEWLRDLAIAPWHPGDTLSYLLLRLIALGGLVGCWVGVSGEAQVSRQLDWLTGGVAALIFAGVADTVWLLTGRRAVQGRKRALLGPVTLAVGNLLRTAHAGEPSPGAERAPAAAALRMTSYHRPDCIFVRGKATIMADVAEHARAGRRPCAVCRP